MSPPILQYYPSNNVGTTIVNAISGKPYNGYIVGTPDEKQLFRVIDSTGYYSPSGTRALGNRSPNKLFYDNYNQYLSHRNLSQRNPAQRNPAQYNKQDLIDESETLDE